MKIANNVNYGLTAGFYGSPKETEWFFDNIEAGVTYANRPQGATTGAWPGFQPFGGWKGSGATGKNGGGYYYVQLYLHEQIRTLVKPAPVKSNGKAASQKAARTLASKKKPVVKRAVKKKARK
jgi:1-pyrroline-5-carboxylate dehydrogenase